MYFADAITLQLLIMSNSRYTEASLRNLSYLQILNLVEAELRKSLPFRIQWGRTSQDTEAYGPDQLWGVVYGVRLASYDRVNPKWDWAIWALDRIQGTRDNVVELPPEKHTYKTFSLNAFSSTCYWLYDHKGTYASDKPYRRDGYQLSVQLEPDKSEFSRLGDCFPPVVRMMHLKENKTKTYLYTSHLGEIVSFLNGINYMPKANKSLQTCLPKNLSCINFVHDITGRSMLLGRGKHRGTPETAAKSRSKPHNSHSKYSTRVPKVMYRGKNEKKRKHKSSTTTLSPKKPKLEPCDVVTQPPPIIQIECCGCKNIILESCMKSICCNLTVCNQCMILRGKEFNSVATFPLTMCMGSWLQGTECKDLMELLPLSMDTMSYTNLNGDDNYLTLSPTFMDWGLDDGLGIGVGMDMDMDMNMNMDYEHNDPLFLSNSYDVMTPDTISTTPDTISTTPDITSTTPSTNPSTTPSTTPDITSTTQ